MNQLSEAQLTAAKTEHRQVAIIAGAGSGKTAVLVERASRAWADGGTVLVFAFTRSAVDEIKSRLETDLQARFPKITTIHGFCYEMLARKANDRGIPMLATDAEVRDLAKKCRSELGYDDSCSLRSVDEALASKPDGNGYASVVAHEVRNRLRESNRIHYDGLIDAACDIISVTPPEELPWTHILCDEAQDLHRGLWRVISALETRGTRNLFLVGDPRQAIFGFTGGDAKAFTSFAEMGTTQTIALNANYRSARHIIDYANRIFNDPAGDMDAVREEWGFVDERPFAGDVVVAVQSLIEKHKRVAVIARTNDELDAAGARLKEAGLDAWRIPRVGDRVKTVARVIAWIRCLSNPNDEMAARRLFGNEECDKQIAAGEVPGKLIYRSPLIPETPEEENEVARFTECAKLGWTPEEYLAAITREELTDADLAPGREASITLATAHGAKGKEWPAVVVLLPGFYGRQKELNTDAKRCLYVAVTRAQDALVLVGIAR